MSIGAYRPCLITSPLRRRGSTKASKEREGERQREVFFGHIGQVVRCITHACHSTDSTIPKVHVRLLHAHAGQLRSCHRPRNSPRGIAGSSRVSGVPVVFSGLRSEGRFSCNGSSASGREGRAPFLLLLLPQHTDRHRKCCDGMTPQKTTGALRLHFHPPFMARRKGVAFFLSVRWEDVGQNGTWHGNGENFVFA